MITTDLYQVASRFVGVKEAAGVASNPQIMAMLHLDAHWPAGDEVPWCSAFVNYIAWLLGAQRSKSLAARSWVKVGVPVALAQAERGMDIVIFSRGSNPEAGHVGFFDRLEGAEVVVLGGNQGDKVSLARFPTSQVISVRRLA